jgi:hypothetical protein
VGLDRAFVQFAGLTAGRTQSFFDFYSGDLEFVGTTAHSLQTTNLLAYTATFGGGFSATLAIEENVERRFGVATLNGFVPPGAAVGDYAYTGDSVPDVIANLRLDQSWGVVQLSGAMHEVRVGNYASFAGVTPRFAAPDAKYGFAVNLGTKINLPMLGAGDLLYLQGTYTKGAPSYVINDAFGWGKTNFSFGGAQALIPDAYLIGNGAVGGVVSSYSERLPTVWGLTAAGLHYWTPTVRQALFASYVQSDAPSSAFLAGGGFATANRSKNFTYWTIGSNVTWSPVKDLDLGAEVNYIHASTGQGGAVSAIATDPVGIPVRHDSVWNTRIKIQRDF